MSLTEEQTAMLALERAWWQRAGSKEQAIRDQLDLTPTAYYAQLNRLLDEPAALAADPVTVKRLRALRDRRAATRRLRHAG